MNYLRSVFTLSALTIFSAGCGGGHHSHPFHALPPETTLCQLVPGVTTEDQAKAILGPAASESNSAPFANLTYNYESATSSAGYGAVMLDFYRDVLRQGATQNLPLPGCWEHGRP